MKMDSAKKLVARYLKVGTSRIKIDPEKTKKVKEAITGEDVKGLISEGVFKKYGKQQSRGRARVLAEKKKAGRGRGAGKRKGTAKARTNIKEQWLKRVRSQRTYIKTLLTENKVDKKLYRAIYRKVKGGFFRSKAHIDIFVNASR